jgi:hypothetical protein
VTTRRFTKWNEDTVRRCLRAYIEGAVRGSKDQAFAMKTIGKYFRTDDRDVLDETYEAVIKSVFNFPPYPAGIPALLQEVEKQHAKAKNAKTEDFVDAHFVRELDQSGFNKRSSQAAKESLLAPGQNSRPVNRFRHRPCATAGQS